MEDATRRIERSRESWFAPADHAKKIDPVDFPFGVRENGLVGSITTTLGPAHSDGQLVSSVFFYCGDDGGDNYRFRATLMNGAFEQDFDQTEGPVTVWRYARFTVFQMEGTASRIDIARNQAWATMTYQQAFLEIKINAPAQTASSSGPLLTPAQRLDYAHAHVGDPPHQANDYSVFGVRWIGGDQNFGITEPPHVFIAHDAIAASNARGLKLALTFVHELGHAVSGEGGRVFHGDHDSSCAFNSDDVKQNPKPTQRAFTLCARHASMMRDRLVRTYSPPCGENATRTFDSDRGREW